MLVERDEGTEGRRGEFGEEDAVGGTVPFEHLRLDQRLGGVWAKFLQHTSILISQSSARKKEGTYLADLLLGLTERQRLGLSEEVGEEDAVVEGVVDRVVRRRGGDEVGGDQLRTLVHELVERVLAVGSSGTPNDRLRYENTLL